MWIASESKKEKIGREEENEGEECWPHVHHEVVLEVVIELVEHEALGPGELGVLRPEGCLPHEQVLGQVRDDEPRQPEDQPHDGDSDQEDPPEPQDQEVLLVEEVVGEDAEVVTPVDGTGGGADTDVAGNLGGEGMSGARWRRCLAM